MVSLIDIWTMGNACALNDSMMTTPIKNAELVTLLASIALIALKDPALTVIVENIDNYPLTIGVFVQKGIIKLMHTHNYARVVGILVRHVKMEQDA